MKNFDMESWLERRESSLRSFCCLAVLLGAEYAMIIPSLWFYLHDVIKTDHVTLYYDLSLGVYYAASILGSFTITIYVDKSRNIKQVMLTLIAMEILGSCVYSVYTSVYFPIAARVIQGLGDVNISLMVAEICRVYPPDECGVKIANIVACFSASFVLSPGLNIIFKYVDFEIWGFSVNYGNFPGLIMALLFSMLFVITHHNVSNLSKEYDLKQETRNMEELKKDETLSHRSDKESKQLYVSGLKEEEEEEGTTKHQFPYHALFLQFDFVLLVSLGFLMSYSIVAFLDVTFPIISSTYYHQNSQFVGALFLATGLLFMIVLQFVKKLNKTVSEHVLLIAGLCVFILSTAFLLCVSIIKNRHHVMGMTFLICYVLTLGICWCVEQVFIRTLIAKMIPSNIQSFGEGVRRSFSSLASIIASMVTGFLLNYLSIQCCVTMIATVCAIICLLARRNSLKDPKPFTYNKKGYALVGNAGIVTDKS